MIDSFWTFAFIVAATAALVSGFDVLFNDGEWVRYAFSQINVPNLPDLFASV